MAQLALPITYGKVAKLSFKRVSARNQEPVGFEIHSFRVYGMPKMKKPKELTGIKPVFSVDYIPKKCCNQVFVLGDDVWVKHSDYLSPLSKWHPGESGMPLAVRIAFRGLRPRSLKTFGYPDCWGGIVSRQEAWVTVKNLMPALERNFVRAAIKIVVAQEEFHDLTTGELGCGEMERMWVTICKNLLKEEARP